MADIKTDTIVVDKEEDITGKVEFINEVMWEFVFSIILLFSLQLLIFVILRFVAFIIPIGENSIELFTPLLLLSPEII